MSGRAARGITAKVKWSTESTPIRKTLKRSPEALKYLAGRGLRSAEMIEHFELGFANRTLGYGLPRKNRHVGAELRGRLQRLGIYRETGHEHFNGSILIRSSTRRAR